MKKTILLLTILSLSACSLAPDYKRPVVEANNTWKNTTWMADAVDQTWWTQFKSEELNGLITQALKNNTDLGASLQRIEQARAQAKIAGAALYPSVDANGGYSTNNAKNTGSTESWNASGSVAYEIDLWQRNRNTAKAAEYGVNAAQFDQEALALLVTSDTVQRYAEILTFKERIRLTNQNIGIFKDTLKVVQARYDEGSASGLELSQQKATLANAQASLETLRQQQAVTETALVVLLGQAPQDFKNTFKTTLSQLTIPQVAPIQPASLLERRPDIRAQEENLKAANANIGVARSALFPSLSLGLTGALAANPATAPVAWSTSAAASVAQRIFAGGALTGQVKLSEARKAELVETYRGTVLAAFKETQDALVTINTSTQREKNLDVALSESRNAYQIAKDRYLNGAADFISLLDAQRTLLQAEDTRIQARLDRLNAALSLFQAMGGGWKS